MEIEIKKKIQVLPSTLRNQIAAGEVVERPASVLKELVENSLDSGADSIEVVLEDGGQSLLVVKDNGCGMLPEDLKLAVTRYATSKIASFEDLLNVSSYGFRGEALPSIASVSSFYIASCLSLGKEHAFDGNKHMEGSFIKVDFGEIVASGPSPIVSGTTIEVRDLFANVPARLKFLKSPSFELKRCQEVLSRFALARPDVGFSLFAGSREIFNFPKGDSLESRISKFWASQVFESLIPVDFIKNDILVKGLTSLPHSIQARGDKILFYVNGRTVSDKTLMSAVREAYKGKLVSKEYPQLILFITVPAEELDVNVHPSKTEVRFRDERSVFSAVYHAIKNTIFTFTESSGDSLNHMDEDLDKVFVPRETGLPLPSSPDHTSRSKGFWGSVDSDRILPKPTFNLKNEEFESFYISNKNLEEPAPIGSNSFKDNGLFSNHNELYLARESSLSVNSFNESDYNIGIGSFVPSSFSYEEINSSFNSDSIQHKGFPVQVGDLLCLGQLANQYLIILKKDALYLLDQHAAHEIVRLRTIEGDVYKGESQLLVSAEDIPVHDSCLDFVKDKLEELKSSGYNLELNNNLLTVYGVPSTLNIKKALTTLNKIVNASLDGIEELLHLRSCHTAIKAGQRLSADEAAKLIFLWQKIPNNEFCPHGRPICLKFGVGELDKMFKRKV